MTGTFSQHAQLLTSQHFNVQRKAPLRASRDVIMSRRIKYVTHRARKPQVSGVEAGCSSEEQLPSCSRPLGFTLRLHTDRSPSPSSPSYQPAAWLGSHHRERLIESYAVFFPECAVHVFFFVQWPLQKTHFPFSLNLSLPLPLSKASLCGVRGREGECGFNQSAGQPPPLIIRSTLRLAEARGRGRWVKESAR